jgi:uncharacterized membrane protein
MVAVHQGNIKDYKFSYARNISEQDTIFAVTKRGIPFVGGLVSLISGNWIIFAALALVVIVALIVARIIVSSRSKKSEFSAEDFPKRKQKKEVLDI